MLAGRLAGLHLLAVCWLLTSCTISQTGAELSCLDEDGKPVDWFIAYKFPKLASFKLKGDELFQTGLAYSYITDEDIDDTNEIETRPRKSDSDSEIFLYRFRDLLLKYLGFREPKVKSQQKKKQSKHFNRAESKWEASEVPVSDRDSIVMRTLAVAYEKNSESINSVFYNDDPEGTSGYESEEEDDSKDKKFNSRRAHAKGVLMLDEQSGNGIWLTHSVPKFPAVRDHQLEYPGSGINNGQTFMCITFDVAKSGKKIVDHLVNMRPLVYDNKISQRMLSMIPALKNLEHEEEMKGRRVKVQPKLTQWITTKGGKVFQLFSKSISFGEDLYAGWIDKEIGDGMYVETWRNGNGGPLDSTCPTQDYHVNNVQDLKYDSDKQWSYTKDHSKWAISEEKDVGVVCIADSNRVASQFKRGGGAVCIKCPTCWNIFSNTIQDVEPCPIGPKMGPKRSDSKTRSAMSRIRSALRL